MPPIARRLAAVPCAGAVLLLLMTGCSGSTGQDADQAPSTAPPGAPALTVEVLADGLDHPWDVARAPDGTLLLDERAGGFTAVLPDGTVQPVAADLDDLFATGETGLMGLVLDPDFASSRRFYSCQGVQEADGAEIQVIAWTVDDEWTTATRVDDPLLGGIPVNRSSGRHGGCRLRFDGDGQLLVGTGDNAVGSNPQDVTSLAGKVLRLDPVTGDPSTGNTWADDAEPATRYVYSYGHRNVQGIALQPGTDEVYTAEQGTSRDDEVNQSFPGANYGYDPDGDDGEYDESVPMTDSGLSHAVAAVWSSGDPTIATSGLTFLAGEAWGSYDGLLVVGVQKDTGLLALELADDGTLVRQFRVPELEDSYGRLRSPQAGEDGVLYITTDNGDGADQLLRVTPSS